MEKHDKPLKKKSIGNIKYIKISKSKANMGLRILTSNYFRKSNSSKEKENKKVQTPVKKVLHILSPIKQKRVKSNIMDSVRTMKNIDKKLSEININNINNATFNINSKSLNAESFFRANNLLNNSKAYYYSGEAEKNYLLLNKKNLTLEVKNNKLEKNNKIDRYVQDLKLFKFKKLLSKIKSKGHSFQEEPKIGINDNNNKSIIDSYYNQNTLSFEKKINLKELERFKKRLEQKRINLKYIFRNNKMLNNSKKSTKFTKENKTFKDINSKILYKKESKLNKYKDDYFIRKIFVKRDTMKNNKSVSLINNKLNIYYSENEIQFDKKLKELNGKLIHDGKKIKHVIISSENTKHDLLDLNSKVTFLKKVVDYVYPNLFSVNMQEKIKHEYRTKKSYHTIFNGKFIQIQNRLKEKNMESYLKKSINLIKV